jgi:hypothetical protein
MDIPEEASDSDLSLGSNYKKLTFLCSNSLRYSLPEAYQLR